MGKLSVMIVRTLALILFLRLKHVNTTENITGLLPTGCQAVFRSHHTQLAVSCRAMIPTPQAEHQLSKQLNSQLSDDQISERLTSLIITDTPLTHVPASICQLLNLRSLNLDRNKLGKLPFDCLTNSTELAHFSAEGNSIVSLHDGVFAGLQRLVSISLSRNHIWHIGLRVFSNSSDLIRLRNIDLSFNNLTSLEPWWYYRFVLGNESSRVTINVSNNQISKFTNQLKFRFRCGMRQAIGTLDISNNKVLHIWDFLNGWRVEFTTLACLLNFRLRGVFRAKFIVGGTSFACDCMDFPFYKFHRAFPRDKLLSDVRCPVNFDSGIFQFMQAITIPLTYFTCDVSDGCPPGCQCVYRPANATLHVDCSATNLSSLPLSLPPLPKSYTRYKLDFSNNKLLRRLESRPYFVNTAVLDVGDCSIEYVDFGVWTELSKMQSPFVRPRVLLERNNIQSVPFEVTTVNFTSVNISLNSNPWKCSCENQWMISWFRSISSTGEGLLCASPSRLEGRNILHSTGHAFCVDPVSKTLTIILSSTLSAAAVLVVSAGAIYRLRVRVYRRWKFHPFDRDDCLGEAMDYDVFLCCSSEDNSPHGLRILELIESKGYRVCYHLRDFLAGEFIVTNMHEAIVRSKRTLCLVSENFLSSSYCMTEFDMAFHHSIALKRAKRLIVLMKLNHPNDIYANDASNDTATLRQYLRQYTYIDYTADDWLDKLLYALPLRGLLQHDQEVTDDVQLINSTNSLEQCNYCGCC